MEKTIYYAEFNKFGRPILFKLSVYKETEKTYSVVVEERILGESYDFLPSRILKSDPCVFENRYDALISLYNKEREYRDGLILQLTKASNMITKLRNMAYGDDTDEQP